VCDKKGRPIPGVAVIDAKKFPEISVRSGRPELQWPAYCVYYNPKDE
jgi:hypothetical protein